MTTDSLSGLYPYIIYCTAVPWSHGDFTSYDIPLVPGPPPPLNVFCANIRPAATQSSKVTHCQHRQEGRWNRSIREYSRRRITAIRLLFLLFFTIIMTVLCTEGMGILQWKILMHMVALLQCIITSKRYSIGTRLSGCTRYWFGKDAPDSLYILLCRYIQSQATHRYVSRSAAS